MPGGNNLHFSEAPLFLIWMGRQKDFLRMIYKKGKSPELVGTF